MIKECKKCHLCETGKKIVNANGPINAKLMVVGPCPNEQDQVYGRAFSERGGRLLDDALNNAGIKRADVYVTHLVKCMPTDTKSIYREPSKVEIEMCSQYLEDEIFKVKPQIIVALGSVPFKYLKNQSNIMKYHGMIFNDEKHNCKVLAAYHPEYVLRQTAIHAKDRFFEDIKKLDRALNQDTSAIAHNYIVVDTMEVAKDLMERLREVNPIAVDIETTGFDHVNDRMLGISFSWSEGTGVYFPLLGKDSVEIWKVEEKELIIKTLAEILKDKKCILHNAKFDLKFLDVAGIKITDFYDTMIAYYLINENETHGLKDLARRNFPDLSDYESQAMTHLKTKETSYAVIPTDVLGKYAAADTDCTLRLYNKSLPILKQKGFIKEPGKFALFTDLMIPLSKVLRQVEATGVKVNVQYMNELGVKWKADAEEYSKQLDEMTGGININSSKQLVGYLFKTIKLKPVKKTKKGAPSTDAATLKILAKQHPMPALLLKYKELHKLISVYIDGMTPLVDKNGRIHGNFNLTGTVTGRLSSNKPNLQNIPRKEEARKIFVASEGHKLLMCDYSQIELRIFACYAGDPSLIESFRKEEDIHTRVASEVLGIPLDQVTSEQRMMAKSINFGLIYGRMAASIADQLGKTEEEAQSFIDEYFTRYKAAAKWMAVTKLLLKEKGYLENIFGRIRRIPEIYSNNFGERMGAERQAVNSLVQGTASDCVNLSAIRIDKVLKQKNLKSKLVLLVHDELVYEVPDVEVEEMKILLKTEMEKIPHSKIIVPLTISMEVGDTWL